MISDLDAMLNNLSADFAAQFSHIFVDGIAYPNEVETPPDPAKGTIWARYFVEFGETRQASIGAVGSNRFRYTGALLVDVFVGPGSGDAAAVTAARAIEDYYRSSIVQGVQFRTPTIVNVGLQGGWWVTRIRCPFIADRVA